MTFKNKKIHKLISSLLIITILIPSLLIISPPKKAEAQFAVADVVGNILETIGNGLYAAGKFALKNIEKIDVGKLRRELLTEAKKIIARRVLAEMTKSVTNWINSGFHGAPLFIENPKSFFGDIAQFQIKNLVNIIGYDSNRFPFGKNYLLGVIDSYKRTLDYNAQYSLSRVTNDPVLLSNYRNVFATGGWSGYIMNSQYPQNNAFGFQLDATNLLNSQFSDEINKVNSALQQGQGFLSPQVCRSDPSLTQNPYKPPQWQNNIVYDDSYQMTIDALLSDPNTTKAQLDQAYTDLATYDAGYNAQVAAAKGTFDLENTCQEGWADTTPGSVVASKIMKSVNIPEDSAWLGQAMGQSLTAIFDALFNKFIGDGLSKLANRVNNQQSDNFSYYGSTFSGTTDPGWSNTPDQEVILDDFKKEVSGKTVVIDPTTQAIIQEDIGNTCATPTPPSYCATTPSVATFVPGAIANTAFEIQLIDNPSINNQNPGLIQVIEGTAVEAKKLDMCIPGPNKNWEIKLDEERDRIINGKLVQETANDEAAKVQSSREAIRELKFAINGFKDWINTKMIASLPSAILFIDAIKELDTNTQSDTELIDKLREKRTALARLNAIETALAPITAQPVTGSAQEKNLISIRKQFDAIASSVANQASIDELQSQLDLQKERKQNLLLLNNQCSIERTAAGWGTPGIGEGGSLSTSSLAANKGLPYFTVYNGQGNYGLYSTGTEREVFCDVPIVSGYSHGEVLRNDEAARANNCPTYNSNKSACYAGVPGPQTANWFSFRNRWMAYLSTPKHDPIAPIATGDAGMPGYQDLPLVNAIWFYGDNTNGFPVSADVSCSLLFKVRDIDYKYAGDENF